jgi:hypothetical protein
LTTPLALGAKQNHLFFFVLITFTTAGFSSYKVDSPAATRRPVLFFVTAAKAVTFFNFPSFERKRLVFAAMSLTTIVVPAEKITRPSERMSNWLEMS